MEACGPTAPPTADPKPPLAQSNQPIYKNHASRWCTLIRPKVVHFEVIGDKTTTSGLEVGADNDSQTSIGTVDSCGAHHECSRLGFALHGR
jgi:hypothetical protein